MMEFIDSYNLTGLVIGISTFLIIGLFHPVVIKCEYYFGTRCWWIFLIFGVLGIISSLYVRQVLCRLYWGFSPFLLLDDPGDLRTKRKGKEGMVSDESETEKGI